MREMLKEIAAKTSASHGHCNLSASDLMDDGSCIQLTIDIDSSQVSRIYLIFVIYFGTCFCTNIVFAVFLIFFSVLLLLVGQENSCTLKGPVSAT